MDGLLLQTMANRKSYAIREKVGKHTEEQRKSLMYLIAEFLRQQGLYKCYETLTEEAHLTNNVQVCDNIDLEIILNEYNDYYHARFHKWPQICKRVDKSVVSKSLGKSSNSIDNNKTVKNPTVLESERNINQLDQLVVTPLSVKNSISFESQCERPDVVFGNDKNVRPLGNLYLPGSDLMEMGEIITREIVMENLNVHWEDIHGLEDCKQSLKEAIVYPTKYPQLFTNLFTPSKGILLYGPPGTGKTMLAKAVATECDLTFFNITASSLVSKWRGDSEKYIRVLFHLANHHAPSIIFIDEIDWIASGEGTGGSDKSEPARRFRAELLSRLDGLVSEKDSRIILLAATNAPWNLDSALLRRLENHVHVDVPDESVRRRMLKIYTNERLHDTETFDNVVTRTNGYSGADLNRLCKQAWIIQMRPIWKKVERIRSKQLENDWIAKALSINDCQYLLESIRRTPCTANHLTPKYKKWKESFSTAD